MARRAKNRKRRQGGPPITLAQLLDRTYPGRSDDRPLVRTFSWWDRAVPPRIAKRARPVRLAGGTLVIGTRSAAWAQELSFHEAELLASIQAVVPEVKRVRIRVGRMPPPPPPPPARPPKTEPIPVGQLPGDVARALARVGDDGLRDALTRAACTSLAPRRRPPREP